MRYSRLSAVRETAARAARRRQRHVKLIASKTGETRAQTPRDAAIDQLAALITSTWNSISGEQYRRRNRQILVAEQGSTWLNVAHDGSTLGKRLHTDRAPHSHAPAKHTDQHPMRQGDDAKMRADVKLTHIDAHGIPHCSLLLARRSRQVDSSARGS